MTTSHLSDNPYGLVRQAWHGGARPGPARQGMAWHGRATYGRRGEAWPGLAWRGSAWQGVAGDSAGEGVGMTLVDAFPYALDMCPAAHCDGTFGHESFGHPHYSQTRWSTGRVTTRFWPVEFSDDAARFRDLGFAASSGASTAFPPLPVGASTNQLSAL